MTFLEIRDKLIEGLWDYLACPVILADQTQPEAEFPFGIYSVTTSYMPDGGLGDYSDRVSDDDVEISRMEMPSATLSFTFCSQNRVNEDGKPISGADEAEALASEAIGYFLHTGYDHFLSLGVTVVEVGQVQDRTVLIVDEAARRVGFDVRIRYTRTDTRVVPSVDKITIKRE